MTPFPGTQDRIDSMGKETLQIPKFSNLQCVFCGRIQSSRNIYNTNNIILLDIKWNNTFYLILFYIFQSIRYTIPVHRKKEVGNS